MRSAVPGACWSSWRTTQSSVAVTNGQTNPLAIALEIATTNEQVDVTSSGVGSVSVDPSQNAGAIVLSEADMDSLPDDPDDLEAQLEAMAGPAAGPNGPQIFIDGFSGGQMPPKPWDMPDSVKLADNGIYFVGDQRDQRRAQERALSVLRPDHEPV